MTASVRPLGQLQRIARAAESRIGLERDTRFRARLDETLDRMLDAPHRVLSLDVFDTLLLRDDSSELRRFWEIGARMAAIAGARRGRGRPAIAPADGFAVRHLATLASYQAGPVVEGSREGCLDEIHRTAARLLDGLDGALHAEFVAAELDYEATRLVPAESLLKTVCRHRLRGGRVVLLTDMYMREHHLRALLGLLGVDTALFDAILSSADHKVSKASGGIFAHVERRLECDPDDIVHVGDNLVSDFRNARNRGWHGLYVPISDADRQRRRADHLAIDAEILARHGFHAGVACPA